MSVVQILKSKPRDITTLPPQRTIAEAAGVMAERRIGAVIITTPEGGIAGILSERDVVRAMAQHGAPALDHPLSQHMTLKVTTGKEADSIRDIMELMTVGKFRHLPIVESGRLIGIVSIGDVVKHRLAEMEAEAQALREYITA